MSVLRASCFVSLAGWVMVSGCWGDGILGPSSPDPCAGSRVEDAVGTLRISAGQDQCASAGLGVPSKLKVRAVDNGGLPVPGLVIRWSVTTGGGSITPDSTLTDATGQASATWTLGAAAGGQLVRAVKEGTAETALFHATARKPMAVMAGGNNVTAQCTSDLWVAGSYAYTGTWGSCKSHGARVLYVWNVGAGVAFVDSVLVAKGTISDNEVSADGTLLLATSEGDTTLGGLHLYSLADPAHPALIGFERVPTGLHTGTFADIGGQRYIFAARDPHTRINATRAALMVFRIQPDSADPIVPVATVIQPEEYGIHDTYVRDGLALVSDWNTGLLIYDVGNGVAGGSPAVPTLVSSIVTGANGLDCNCVHNSWWYHDTAGVNRYVFVGQEGPGLVHSTSSGDIHVVDVSDLHNPDEVAFYHMAGAGVHNFWMDETRGILYTAYYNGGVVALDVTGTLSGDLQSREIARLQPGGPGNTYVWGVMLANGALWVSDMVSGFWKVSVP
jgi:hypothetical protein